MPLTALLAAAALAAPQYSIDFDDYPDKALELERSATVLADVTVSPNGEMTRCETVEVAGDPDLGAKICNVFAGKRHRPARFGDGEAAWFLERDVYKMVLPGTSPASMIAALRKPDAILEVAALPSGMAALDAKVVVAVNAAGDITECGPDTGDKVSPVIEAVCANAESVPREIFRDESGTALPYVSRLRFRLQTTGSAATPVS